MTTDSLETEHDDLTVVVEILPVPDSQVEALRRRQIAAIRRFLQALGSRVEPDVSGPRGSLDPEGGEAL